VDLIQNIALGAGLAWASGIRLYAVLFLSGLMARFGFVTLPETLEIMTHPIVMTASGTMFVAEFLADKIPAFDSIWDAIHTFIRIPAGALLAAGSLGTMDPAYIAAAAIVGGVIASSSHATKAGSRAIINTSPEPISNWTASFAEDLIAPAGLALAIKFPLVFLGFLLIFLIVAFFLIRFLIRSMRNLLARVRGPATTSA
jgi:Domain of unknown function (DUF4126)